MSIDSDFKEYANTKYNDSDEHCLEFSRQIAKAIFDVKVCLDSVGILVSLLVIIFIWRSRNYKKFVYRLVMYLMVVNVLQAVCQIFEQIPVEVAKDERVSVRNGSGWLEMCKVLGYLDIVTSWMGNLVIIWIILALGWRIHHLQRDQHDRVQTWQTQNHIKSYKWEIFGVLLLFIGPFLFGLIPFTVDMYGLSGLWCWIKTAERNGCDNSKLVRESLILMLFMFYGPLVVIISFGFVCMIVFIVLLRRSSRHFHGGNRKRYQRSMKEIGMVLVYPLIYCLFCVFLVVNRIYSATLTDEKDRPLYYPLWIVHTVADASRIAIPALAFLLHPYVWKNVISHKYSVTEGTRSEYTHFSVPPEGDDIGEGYRIRPTRMYGSTDNGNSII